MQMTFYRPQKGYGMFQRGWCKFRALKLHLGIIRVSANKSFGERIIHLLWQTDYFFTMDFMYLLKGAICCTI